MAFSSNLQQLRKRANLSQEHLAEQLHITRQAVSKWESGQSLPDADTCLKLCKVLGVSPNELLSEPGISFLSAPPDEKSGCRSDYLLFSIFMISILLCGTILLVCNLYNGNYFEPYVHTLSVFMVCGSIIAFACVTSIRLIRKKRKS